MSDEYRPRLSIEITPEQNQKLSKMIPWGIKNKLFSIIIDDLLELMEVHGEKIIMAVVSKQFKVKDYAKGLFK